MNDPYYYKSLLATVIVLSGFFGFILAFVYATGVAGGLIIFSVLVVFLTYFYSGSRGSDNKRDTGGTT